MGELVSLRQARKRRLRAQDAARADANRAAHGVSKQAKDAADRLNRRSERVLDQHRLEPELNGGPAGE